MDNLKIDDQLTIVNRSREYHISKEKLTCKIPYFEKMLSHDLKESKENKIVLDFDQRAIESIFRWIKTGKGSVKMDYVIALCDILDYFGLPDSFIAPRVTYFHDNFTIEHLPIVIPQVTSTSKLINSSSLNAFICRYFTKIANANVWLNYPLATIEYICKLDLMVHSEMQVFEAIMRWATFECDSRKKSSELLLKLVRWCRLEDKDLSKIKENELFKSLGFNLKICSNGKGSCDCNCNRTEQEYFVMIEKYGRTRSDGYYDMRIIVLANNLQPLFHRILKLDQSLPGHIMHDEHISDISYTRQHSENKTIRIDWKHDKYRWLDFRSYHYKLLKYISMDSTNGESLMSKVPFSKHYTFGRTLLEAKDKFILINKDANSFYCLAKPTVEKVMNSEPEYADTYHIQTILDNIIYMLIEDFAFIEFDIDHDCEFEIFQLQKIKNNSWFLDILHLTSKQANDDRVILFDESTKKFYSFNVSTKQWSPSGQILDFFGHRNTTKVLSFTSAFISVDIINFA